MTNTRKLTFPLLNEVKRMFRKCIGKPLTDDDRERAMRFDVAKEIEKAKAIMGGKHHDKVKPVDRFTFSVEHEIAHKDEQGAWVKFSDYEALSGKYHELKARSEIDSRTVEAQAKRIAELEAIDEQQLDVAREFCRQLQIENKKLKAATTECYEKNLDLNLENFELKAKNAQLQFLLDSVMLEYCPDEMTDEQMENWSKHQKKVDTSNPEYYKSDTYKNNVKFPVDMIK